MKKRKLIGLVTMLLSLGISGCVVPGGEVEGDDDGKIEYVATNDGHYKLINGEKSGALEPHVLVDSKGDKKHVPVDATCDRVGKAFKECTICGRFIDQVVPPLGHDWVNQATGEGAATCTRAGVVDLKCSRCDATKTETGSKPLGHQLTAVDTGVDGVTKGRCTRQGCTGGEIELDVSKAQGWNQSTVKMNGKASPDNQSTWNVAGIVEDGVYDIQIEGVMSYSSHGDRKWYNMAKASLCVNNQVEETLSDNPDTATQDDYRYFFKINNSTTINPTVKDSWETLGYTADSPVYGEICRDVNISGATSFSLMHGNIGFSMIISKIKLIKH